jgi:hypothetical protein
VLRKTLHALPVIALLCTTGCDSGDMSPFARHEDGDAAGLREASVTESGTPSTGAGGSAGASSTGAGGVAARAGTGGAAHNDPGGPGDATTQMDAGDGATSGSGSDVDGGTEPMDGATVDGGTEPIDGATDDGAPVSCTTRSVWYADADGDGHGSAATAVVGCTRPGATGWATNSDDCDDHDARVHPGQATYFGTPYAAAGGDSFDYDCSGNEDPDTALPRAPSSCALLGVVTCGGAGYLATSRAGAGKSSLCGSDQKSVCEPTMLVLCGPVTVTADTPFGCR